MLIRGLPVEDRPIAESAAAYWGIGTYFGSARSQNAKGHVLGHVRDLGLSSTRTRTCASTRPPSGRISTPTPATSSALLCLKTAKSGGLSSLTSSMAIYNEMAKRRPDLVARLFEPLPTDRRGEVPEGKKPWFDIADLQRSRRALCRRSTRGSTSHSAQRFPEAPPARAPRTSRRSTCSTSWPTTPICGSTWQFRPGDMQFVHNHTILHDRTAFEDWPEPERKRHLLRLWLAAPGARPLPPVYAERYGSVDGRQPRRHHLHGHRLHAPLEAV